MKSIVRKKVHHLYSLFNSDIFKSKLCKTDSFGNTDDSAESSYLSEFYKTAALIKSDWGGVNPTFFTKTTPPLSDDYRFEFFDGLPTHVDSYENVIYHPTYHCLYTSDGVRIDKSSYWTRQQQAPQQIEVPRQISKSEEKFIYIGDYTANMHYGHFLIEALGPLYYLLYDNETRVLCNEVDRPFKSTFIDDFFNLANFKNKFCSFNNIVQIKNVIVPEHSLAFGYKAYSGHKLIPEMVAQKVVENIIATQQPVYFSRTRLSGLRKILQEDVLEDILRSAGVMIIYPEQLTLKQQIELINKHETIIACSGSALHTILFDVMGNKQLVIIEDEDKFDKNFFVIDAIKSVNSVYISALHQERPSDHSANRAVNRHLDVDFTKNSLKSLGII